MKIAFFTFYKQPLKKTNRKAVYFLNNYSSLRRLIKYNHQSQATKVTQ